MFIYLLLAQAAATHKETYLTCEIIGQRGVQIAANEGSGSVSLVTADGISERLPAVFTARDVRFGDDTNSYVLSRTDLTIKSTLMFNGASAGFSVPGKCALAKTPKRAF